MTAAEARDAWNTKLSQVYVELVVVRPFESLVDFLSTASKTLWEHPDILLELLGGVATVVGGVVLGAGGGGLTITGAGAVAGVPALVEAGTLVGTGGAMIGDAAGRWYAKSHDNHGFDTGNGRDDWGHWATGQEKKPWLDKQEQCLKDYEKGKDVEVVRKDVVAKLDQAPQNGRLYDGLVENSDGTYTGIEVKSGSAFDKYYAPSNTQREFDEMVNSGTPAHAKLDGKDIVIREVVVVRVP
ncbi:MAG: hypothetical protein B7X32_05825 [Microbacterium sp. 13-71-7]|nr:MAG: hypothetical protein B7X32_05825 [Microbacterium sp. 13-71-7]